MCLKKKKIRKEEIEYYLHLESILLRLPYNQSLALLSKSINSPDF